MAAEATWQRARSEEQIEQRIGEIVDATARLYERKRFEEITFVMIAKEAGFTRSNLYRYFQTKEDIFLELLNRDILLWRMDVLNSLGVVPLSLAEFAQKWVDLFVKHKRMIKLFTILYTLLEPNATLEALTDFKRDLVIEMGMLTEFLAGALPFRSPEAAAEFLMVQSSLAMGMAPMFGLTSKQKAAMAAVGMDSDPGAFRVMFVRSVESLLRGLTDA